MVDRRRTAGKSGREGIGVQGLFRLFSDEATAEAWFVKRELDTIDIMSALADGGVAERSCYRGPPPS